MKKIFGLLLLCATCVFVFLSCSKDEDDKYVPGIVEKNTTYTFRYSAESAPDGFNLDITLFEYNDKNEIVGQKTVNDVYQGYFKTFTANKNAKKVKVYMVTSRGDASVYTWVQQVFYLESGSNVTIDVTGDIRVGSHEP